MNKKQIFIFLMCIVMLLPVFAKKKNKKKNKKAQNPQLVEELVMPSGFNNEYVKKLLNNETIDFFKPTLRVNNFEMPENFLDAIKDPHFDMVEILKS